jgi:hypothetical protein
MQVNITKRIDTPEGKRYSSSALPICEDDHLVVAQVGNRIDRGMQHRPQPPAAMPIQSMTMMNLFFREN